MPKYESTVDELIAATADAREMIREAHAATKDLRQAIREAHRMIDESNASDIRTQFNTILVADAETVLDDIRQNMDKHVLDFLEQVKDGLIPVKTPCPNCAAVIITLDTGRETPCPGCGHRIRLVEVPRE